jgi:hypothetical protein
MGAFNTVKAEATCPYCSNTQLWTVQFKYGNCWQFEYRIGKKIRWGGNKKGQNVGGNVRTPGIAEEPCGKCGKTSLDAVVYFRNNIIERIELVNAPLNLKGYFEILSSEGE